MTLSGESNCGSLTTPASHDLGEGPGLQVETRHLETLCHQGPRSGLDLAENAPCSFSPASKGKILETLGLMSGESGGLLGNFPSRNSPRWHGSVANFGGFLR